MRASGVANCCVFCVCVPHSVCVCSSAGGDQAWFSVEDGIPVSTHMHEVRMRGLLGRPRGGCGVGMRRTRRFRAARHATASQPRQPPCQRAVLPPVPAFHLGPTLCSHCNLPMQFGHNLGVGHAASMAVAAILDGSDMPDNCEAGACV